MGRRHRCAAETVPRPKDVVESFTGPFGLYVHVPFCRSICPFCPYNKVLVRDGLVAPYFAALRDELDLYGVTELRLESLYVGGGTPSLCLEEVGAVVERLDVVDERAIEVIPNHVDAAHRLEAARARVRLREPRDPVVRREDAAPSRPAQHRRGQSPRSARRRSATSRA